MRTIKFRCWDFENEEMISGDALAFEHYAPLVDLLSVEGIMQYTGLKDKKGIEIYEDDILQASNGEKGLYEVCWEDAGFKRKYKFIQKYEGKEWEEVRFFPIHSKHFNVVGNIYENPELLK